MRPVPNKEPKKTGNGEESIMVAEEKDIFDLVPHQWQRVSKILTSQEGVLSQALPGDYVRFMKSIGGHGGHWLYVNDFQVIIQMFPMERNL